MRGSGVWHAEQAWLGHVATDVLIEVEDGRIFAVAENVQPPADAVKLEGFTFPGLANVHSHDFQESLRGRTETGGGDVAMEAGVRTKDEARRAPWATIRSTVADYLTLTKPKVQSLLLFTTITTAVRDSCTASTCG